MANERTSKGQSSLTRESNKNIILNEPSISKIIQFMQNKAKNTITKTSANNS